MKLIPNRWLLMLLAITLPACGAPKGEGPKAAGDRAGSRYTSPAIGWTIEIPDGWSIIPRDELRELSPNGSAPQAERFGQPVSSAGWKPLINFRRNESNSFLSSLQVWDGKPEEEWESRLEAYRQQLLATYQATGVPMEAVDTETVMIDGLEFKMFEIRLLGPEETVVLTQQFYNRLINDYNVRIMLDYNTKADRDVMIGALQNSKFRN
ncbi:MAG: hypothetical protein MK108_19625 [Mariniblastus sp.]|nr:hypothetical protein [Mariniblastus sp.]